MLFATSVLFLDTLFGEAGRDVRVMASVGILINAAFQVVKVRNMIIGAGVLPSGNDVRGVIMGDAVGAFVVGLPLAILLGLHTPLGVCSASSSRASSTRCAKLAIFTWRARRIRWDALARGATPARARPPLPRASPPPRLPRSPSVSEEHPWPSVADRASRRDPSSRV